ncbi:MAG TPA: sigma-70 family RNA polymerase sigma factor [Polyangia bacterium]|nr:sigma-70 family RNA polymerase sigma factor [Polyangia bacterium]
MATGFADKEWLDRERALLRRARAGDRAALGELYAAFAEPLYVRILMPRLGHAQAAEDALSETFCAALEHLDEFEDRGGSIWFWLARIAVNKAVDQHRRRGRSGRALASFEELLAPLWGDATDAAAALESQAEQARLRAAVSQVLAQLNPRYRRAIELRFLEDRPRLECAQTLGVTLGTFDVVLLRALRAFRTQWLRALGAPPEQEGGRRGR